MSEEEWGFWFGMFMATMFWIMYGGLNVKWTI